jgi:hypothetical protein
MVVLLCLAVEPASGERSSSTTQAPAYTRVRSVELDVARLVRDGQRKSYDTAAARAIEDLVLVELLENDGVDLGDVTAGT